MSRNARTHVKGNKGTQDKGTSPAKGKGKGTHTYGTIVKGKEERGEIASLLATLDEQRESKDREGQKGTRRKLRSLGYWGGTRTRTNWIGRVPDAKRKDVVSLA